MMRDTANRGLSDHLSHSQEHILSFQRGILAINYGGRTHAGKRTEVRTISDLRQRSIYKTMFRSVFVSIRELINLITRWHLTLHISGS